MGGDDRSGDPVNLGQVLEDIVPFNFDTQRLASHFKGLAKVARGLNPACRITPALPAGNTAAIAVRKALGRHNGEAAPRRAGDSDPVDPVSFSSSSTSTSALCRRDRPGGWGVWFMESPPSRGRLAGGSPGGTREGFRAVVIGSPPPTARRVLPRADAAHRLGHTCHRHAAPGPGIRSCGGWRAARNPPPSSGTSA